MITVEPIACTVRMYASDDANVRIDRYVGVATITFMGREKVFMSAKFVNAPMKLLRQFRQEIADHLRGTGVKEVECIRHGRRKVYTDDGVTWNIGW